MKTLLLLPVLGIGFFSMNDSGKPTSPAAMATVSSENKTLNLTTQQPNEKMLAVIFRHQDFCRAELKDFVYNAEFKVVGATIYFSGTNFKGVEKGTITSNSLAPVKSLMLRCGPGSMVIFDNVKVKGPDEMIRGIAGVSFILH